MENLVAFVLAGLALTGSPGPATLSLAANGAAFGARRSVSFLAGINFGLLAVLAITASGVTLMLFTVPAVAFAASLIAGAYILYLAYRVATAPPLGDKGSSAAAPSFAGGFVLNLVNPKAYAAMTALFSGFQLIAGDLRADALAKTVVLFVMVSVINVAWLFIGAALTRFLKDPGINRAINIAFALLLVVSVAFALLI